MMSPRRRPPVVEVSVKVAIGIGGPASGRDGEFGRIADFVVEAEKLGVDQVWSAEAWGHDAVSPLAFVAGRTSRIKLGTGIMQISARAPAMTAMTALTMASITEGRFILGLGVSGPQVVEGLHGVPYDRPLTRLRETIDILKLAFAGEKIRYDGEVLKYPRPGGKGKALRLSQPANPNIPIYLATLGPRSLEFTGAAADGWVGTSFTPEHGEGIVSSIRAGAQGAGRALSELDLQAGGAVAFGDDVEALVKPRKAMLAFTLGAMGSAEQNFYNDAFRRQGYEAVGIESQRLWLDGKRAEAAEVIPDAMVLASNLLGTEEMVRDRIAAYRKAGITTLRVTPQGKDMTERLRTLGRVMDLVRA